MQGATHKHEHTRATAVLLMGGPNVTSDEIQAITWRYNGTAWVRAGGGIAHAGACESVFLG